MKNKPTDSELTILQVLWERGASTVREVNDVLSQSRSVGYTTTLKIMQIMHEKGLVTRDASRRTHVFEAGVTRENTQNAMLDRFVESAFGGSAAQLVMQALGNKNTTPEELAEIRAYLDQLDTPS